VLLREILDDFVRSSVFSKDSKAHFIEIGSSPLYPSPKNDGLRKFEKNISNLIESERFLLLSQENSLFVFHNISEEEGNR